MDLKKVLQKIYKYDDENKLKVKIDDLKFLGVHSPEDLQCLDKEEMLRAESFNKIEIGKLLAHADKMDYTTLESVLEDIFLGTSKSRLSFIEQQLNMIEVFYGKDVVLVDTDKLRKDGKLTEVEVSKIEQYIKKTDRDKYDEIANKRQQEFDMKKLESDFSYTKRVKYLDSLYEEKKQLTLDWAVLGLSSICLINERGGCGGNAKSRTSKSPDIKNLLEKKEKRLVEINNELKSITYGQ